MKVLTRHSSIIMKKKFRLHKLRLMIFSMISVVLTEMTFMEIRTVLSAMTRTRPVLASSSFCL
jgi:hypothetical protein